MEENAGVADLDGVEWAKENILKPWSGLVRLKGKKKKVRMPIFLVDFDAASTIDLLSKAILDFLGRDASMLTIIRNGNLESYYFEEIKDGYVRELKKISKEEVGEKKARYIKTVDARLFSELREAHERSRGDMRKYLAGVVCAFMKALREEWITFDPEFEAFAALKALSRSVELDREQLENLATSLKFDLQLGMNGFQIGIRFDESNLRVSEGKPLLRFRWERLSKLLRNVSAAGSMEDIYEKALVETVNFAKDAEAWDSPLLPEPIRQRAAKAVSPTLAEKMVRVTRNFLGQDASVLLVVTRQGRKPIFSCLLSIRGGRLSRIRSVPLSRFKEMDKKNFEEAKLELEKEGFINLAVCADVKTINKFLSPSALDRMWAMATIKQSLNEVIISPETPFLQQFKSMSELDIYLKFLIPFMTE